MSRMHTIIMLWVCAVVLVFPALGGTEAEYPVILDEHNTPLPTEARHCNYYNATGGDRGVLNVEDIEYIWDGDSAYTATVIRRPGLWTWGGIWYSPIRILRDKIPLDFGAIFGPYVKPEYQGQITDVEVFVGSVASPSSNAGLQLRIELKDAAGGLVGSKTWTNLTSLSYPYVFTWVMPDECKVPVTEILWVLDRAQVGDSITVDRVGLKARVPDLASVPTQEQAFLWTYSWLMANHDPATGMFQDRSNFGSGDMENVTATGKAAKIVYYAYRKGYTTREHAEQVITKIAATLLALPRGPAGINTLWPHFTRNGGQEALPPHDGYSGTEWSSGDTAFAALDIIAALQMLGDPHDQIPSLEQFLRDIDWDALLTPDGCISHGYRYEGVLLPGSWRGFGMETVGVNWAYASATGNVACMESPPSDNGSGFIDNAQYPMVLSGLDRWCNDWDSYREGMADVHVGWYAGRNPYLAGSGLFGLSAAECPEAYWECLSCYKAYGVGGKRTPPEDGDSEVIVLHYPGMISDIRPEEARHMWEVLRDGDAPFLEGRVIISPLNNVESMRVSKTTGQCTINHLKGSWNLALQAEGWALADPALRAELAEAVETDEFLRAGYQRLLGLRADFGAAPTVGVPPLTVTFSDQSLGGPTTWFWEFGDGATSTEQNPTHTYESCDTYTVILTVRNAWCSHTKRASDYITTRGTFVDVPCTHPFWQYIEAIVREGITSGCSATPRLYCPLSNITRAQMAVFIIRAMGQAPYNNPIPTFADVPGGHWAYGYIEKMYQLGITGGCTTNPPRYCPDSSITRAQMAVFIIRAIGQTPYSNPTPTFSDVPTSHWAYGYIEKTYQLGITGGCGTNPLRYCPDSAVTRSQMAVFICRAFAIPL